jgi:hypothetical protein
VLVRSGTRPLETKCVQDSSNPCTTPLPGRHERGAVRMLSGSVNDMPRPAAEHPAGISLDPGSAGVRGVSPGLRAAEQAGIRGAHNHPLNAGIAYPVYGCLQFSARWCRRARQAKSLGPPPHRAAVPVRHPARIRSAAPTVPNIR